MHRNGDDRESLTGKIDILPASFNRNRRGSRARRHGARTRDRSTASRLPRDTHSRRARETEREGERKEGRDADPGPGSGPSYDDRENRSWSVYVHSTRGNVGRERVAFQSRGVGGVRFDSRVTSRRVASRRVRVPGSRLRCGEIFVGRARTKTRSRRTRRHARGDGKTTRVVQAYLNTSVVPS